MKKYIVLFIAIVSLYGCNNQKKNEKSTKQIKSEANNKSKEYVEYYARKVSLLAIVKNLNSKILQSILIDYYSSIYESDGIITIEQNENTIKKISVKYNISEHQIASLIYNFEYEMLTKDEIYEIESEKNIANDDLEMQENY